MNINELIEHGLPEECVELLRGRGFSELTTIQRSAVAAGVLDGKNVLAAAPTSSGKTLIGELVAATIAGSGLAVYLVSHKALARQVFGIFQTRYLIEDVPYLHSGILTGDDDSVHGDWNAFDVVVSTYERFYAAIASAGTLPTGLTTVVIDEVQHLGDATRGPALEFLIASLLHAEGIQVVGLSATIPNAPAIADWLSARLVSSENREPPLEQEVWIPNQRLIFREGTDTPEKTGGSSDTNVGVVIEALLAEGRGPIAVMATTRPNAEKYVGMIADRLPVLNPIPRDLVDDFRSSSDGPESIGSFDEGLGRGVGIHTADLNPEQRFVIEQAFSNGTLKVIVATPTLVAGVNLPIRTVVYPVLTRWNGSTDASIDVAEYVNGAGRAGRLGFHEKGTAVLLGESIAQARKLVRRFIHQEPEMIESQFGEHSLAFNLLHMVAMFGQGTVAEITAFAAKTLWGHERGYRDDSVKREGLAGRLKDTADRAEERGWIDRDEQRMRLSPVGRAIVVSGLEPDDASAAHDTLQQYWTTVGESDPLEDDSVARMLCAFVELAAMDDYIPRESKGRNRQAAAVRRTVEAYFVGDPTRMQCLGAGYLVAQSELQVLRPDLAQELMRDRAIRGRCTERCFRLLAIAAAIARCGEDQERSAFQATLLSEAVRLQMPLAAVPIAQVLAVHRVRGVGRERTIRLASQVGGELGRVLKLEATQLAAAVGTAQVEGVRQAVLAHLDGLSKQQSERQLRESADHPAISELVECLLREQGTALEPYVCEALNRLGWDLRCVDQNGNTPHPDLRGSTPNGQPVAIECKTPDEYDKEISRKESKAILKKVPSDSTETLVTVGRPQFSFSGVQDAHSSIHTGRPFHLVAVSTIIEALLLRELDPALGEQSTECFVTLAHVDLQRFKKSLRSPLEMPLG